MKKVIMATLGLMLFSAAGFAATVPAASTSTVSTATNKVKAKAAFCRHHHRRHHRKVNGAAF
jgi:hypothetical protein